MKYFILLVLTMLLFILPNSSIKEIKINFNSKKLIKIAVVDSGFTITELSKNVRLCETGHKDFTTTGLLDHHGHGTHIMNTIVSNINSDNYCIIIVKWWDPHTPKYYVHDTSTEVFEYLNTIPDLDVINYSAGGHVGSSSEKSEIYKLLHKGVKIFVAAGNDGANLNKKCNYYPACYHLHNLNVIGNIEADGTVADSSNYGSVVTGWENGVNVFQDKGKGFKENMTGTSQATAVASGKAINRMINQILK